MRRMKIAIDVLLAIDLVVVMATALIEEAPHEYLGIALVVLAIAHVVLNRRWFAGLARGRWNVVRVLQVVAIVGLLACIAGQAVSAVVLSKHALWFLPAIEGSAWARSVHMLCSYWAFAFAFAHVGLQFKGLLARAEALKALREAPDAAAWALRVVWFAIAAVGVWSFMHLGLADYMLARAQFAAADQSVPLALRLGQFAAIAALIAGVFHYLRLLLDTLGK